ncbi:hypothetical protein PL9214520387 [Planktothrix tepida PCC 9214]|uniref:Uncharacterized protein n=1 Tax=Planktothrix tepida PCC 9214 TaxID=671072 RepID=A0A1J1LMT2_9CYAN|nr:hypothetical protein PL9214520387 [Planktothrix tepida PCC 9214]
MSLVLSRIELVKKTQLESDRTLSFLENSVPVGKINWSAGKTVARISLG